MQFKKKSFKTPSLGDLSVKSETRMTAQQAEEKFAQIGKAAKEAQSKFSQQEPLEPIEEDSRKRALAEQQAAIQASGFKGFMYPPPASTCMPANISCLEPRWLSSTEVAKHIHVSIRRLAKMRKDKTGPKFYQLVDGLVLYNVHDVDAWVMAHDVV